MTLDKRISSRAQSVFLIDFMLDVRASHQATRSVYQFKGTTASPQHQQPYSIHLWRTLQKMPLLEPSCLAQSDPITGHGLFSKLISVKTHSEATWISNGISEDQNPARIMNVHWVATFLVWCQLGMAQFGLETYRVQVKRIGSLRCPWGSIQTFCHQHPYIKWHIWGLAQ